MKTTALRNRAVAALLLLPLATSVMATTVAQAQPARAAVPGDAMRHRDYKAPRISHVSPGDGVRVGEHGPVHLFARLGDEGSGVDATTVRLRIDGRDVTLAAQVSADEVHFRQYLANGRHIAVLEVRDHAGNATRKAWSFRVVDTDGYRDGGDS